MIRSIWRITGNMDDANDAFQEAMAAIMRRMDRVRNHPNPQALVLRICIDEAYSVLRRKRSGKLVFVDKLDEELADRSLSAGEIAQNKELEEEILQAMSELPPSQSTAVFMRFVLCETYKRIASALDCEEETARKHVSLGRASLAQTLSHLLTECCLEKLI